MASTKTPVKNLIVGILLALLANVIFVSTSFIVGKWKLLATEICFMKSFLQTTIFLGVIIVKSAVAKRDQATDDYVRYRKAKAKGKSSKRWTLLWAIIYSLAVGGMTMTAYVGVKMIPIPDFVVFGHTSSVFTLFFSACFLRERLSILKCVLVASVVAGVVLVVQPTFIFGQLQVDLFDGDNETLTVKEGLRLVGTSEYYAGVVVSFLCAASAGLTNVASAKSKELSRAILMVFGGIGTVIVALVAKYSLGHLFTSAASLSLMSLNNWQKALATSGVSIASIIAGLACIVANQNCPPTVFAVVRATEILLALVVDQLLFKEDQHETEDWRKALHTAGALIVLASVSLMATSEYIQQYFDRTCGCGSDKDKRKVSSEKVIELEVVSTKRSSLHRRTSERETSWKYMKPNEGEGQFML